jgi:hypothetical protein
LCCSHLGDREKRAARSGAASLGNAGTHAALDTVRQIAQAITPFLGETAGTLLFGLGMTRAAPVATIVVTLTAARTLGEVLGVKHSLEHAPHEAPWFYGIYTMSLAASGLFVASGVNLISLSAGVQVMNALLLPPRAGISVSARAPPASAPSAERRVRSDRRTHHHADRGVRCLCRLSGRRGIGQHADVPGRPSRPSASGSGRSSDHRDSNMAVQRGAADAIDHAGIRLLDLRALMRTQHSIRSPLRLRLPYR